MAEIRCSFGKVTVRNDMGCQLCWMKEIKDPNAATREECMRIHFKAAAHNKNDNKRGNHKKRWNKKQNKVK